MSILVDILPDKKQLGVAATAYGAEKIREALAERGTANIIVATGASQFEMLEALVKEPDIAWNYINIFHLDEYVGMPIDHPASFRKYLWERFHRKLPVPPQSFCYLDGEKDASAETERASALIRQFPIDVAFVGIGENGHLAFNDPPANFETDEPYIIVNLDTDCRRQQMGEGWFNSLEEVPEKAISMSIRQIMKSGHLVVTVPDTRKAEAVGRTVNGPINAMTPASIMQEHPSCHLFLDKNASREIA